jgi:hypothetical protein
MWEQITQADIQEAKHRLDLRRAETLSRHAEEIKSLDAQLHDIESFERIVAAFFEEYMNPESQASGLKPVSQDTATPSTLTSHALALEPPNAPALELQIQQRVSPGFELAPRARSLLGGNRGARRRRSPGKSAAR